jgi:hypothetical protein
VPPEKIGAGKSVAKLQKTITAASLRLLQSDDYLKYVSGNQQSQLLAKTRENEPVFL